MDRPLDLWPNQFSKDSENERQKDTSLMQLTRHCFAYDRLQLRLSRPIQIRNGALVESDILRQGWDTMLTPTMNLSKSEH